ncbi:MAG: LysM peptidoglycan-binding domain-containing protein [Halobacteriovoraceae bacterium]|jgi:hypothetical protein|nr:LysM peptidoglycan-binding domain-containing protein [Halobacteriovoraceae bacterium]MBT5095782.1 LysM peptidoglycan-binding domain-containing protein [Halobacteriovoraceae bacterium]
MKIRNSLIALTLLSTTLNAGENIHRVRKGDTLSQIAHAKIYGPIYGQGGSLESILKLNPLVNDKNLIFSPQSILLPTLGRRGLLLGNKKRKKDVVVQSSAASKVANNDILNELATKDSKKLQLIFGLGFENQTINATNKISQRKSNLTANSPSARIGIAHKTKNGITNQLELELKNADFKNVNDRSVRTNGSSFATIDYRLGKEFNNGNGAHLGAGFSERIFLKNVTETTMDLEKIRVPIVGVGGNLILSESRNTLFGLRARANYLFASLENGVDAQSGYEIKGAVDIQRGRALFSPYMNYQEQDTTLATQNNLAIGLDFNFKI